MSEDTSKWEKMKTRLSLQSLTQNKRDFTNIEDMKETVNTDDDDDYIYPHQKHINDNEKEIQGLEELRRVTADISLTPTSIEQGRLESQMPKPKTHLITVIAPNPMASANHNPRQKLVVKEAKSELRKMPGTSGKADVPKELATGAKSDRGVVERAMPGMSKPESHRSTTANPLLGNWTEERRKTVIEMFTVVTTKEPMRAMPLPCEAKEVEAETEKKGKEKEGEEANKETMDNVKRPLTGKAGKRIKVAWGETEERTEDYHNDSILIAGPCNLVGNNQGNAMEISVRESSSGTSLSDSKDVLLDHVEVTTSTRQGDEKEDRGRDGVSKSQRVLDTMKKLFPSYKSRQNLEK